MPAPSFERDPALFREAVDRRLSAVTPKAARLDAAKGYMRLVADVVDVRIKTYHHGKDSKHYDFYSVAKLAAKMS